MICILIYFIDCLSRAFGFSGFVVDINAMHLAILTEFFVECILGIGIACFKGVKNG